MMTYEDSDAVMRAACEAQRMILATAQEDYEAAIERRTPSFMYKPRLSLDDNQWCALYGENLQDGVAGFGDSPELAYADFNRAWGAKLPGRRP